MNWALVGVDPAASWVNDETTTVYEERPIVLRPRHGDRAPDVSTMIRGNDEYDAALTFLHRFLSAMVWRRREPIRVVGHGGGTHQSGVEAAPRRSFIVIIAPGYETNGLVENGSRDQQLAMALYREGLGSGSDAYRFFTFFRILNIRLKTPKDQIDWINRSLGQLNGYSQEKVEEIAKSSNVGEYLYAWGRNALAHAYAEPLVDPDDFEDIHRMNLEVIVVQDLVELFMETQLQLPGQ